MDLLQPENDSPESLDISRCNSTGELYALRWDRQAGLLLALAGPLLLEEITTLRPESLTWQPAADVEWATREEWFEQAVVGGQSEP